MGDETAGKRREGRSEFCEASVVPDIKSFRHIPRNGTAGPYGSSPFSFLRILHTDIPMLSQFAILPTVTEVSCFPASCQPTLCDVHKLLAMQSTKVKSERKASGIVGE